MNYTKGEWRVNDDLIVNAITQTGRTAEIAAIAATVYPEEEWANANLISAAPDMYEALKEMMAGQEIGIEDGRVVIRATPSPESILKAQRALAKAEGGK